MSRTVRQFIRKRGDALLERLSERPFTGADWTIASHGAVIRVAGEHDDLFERLVVVLPRPTEATPDKFRTWAETRLAQLGWYVEKCNSGKLVSTISHDASVVSVFMLRLGRDPNDPATELPEPGAFPGLLHDFVLNLDRYVQAIGDDELRYVRALRLYRVPRNSRTDEFVLGVDVLPTVIGLAEPTVPISPLTLVRGVLGELAELLDQRREEAQAAASIGRPVEWRRTRRRVAEMERVVDQLDALCARIDTQPPTLAELRDALKRAEPARRTWVKPLLQALLLAGGIAAAAWAWRL